MTNIIYWTYMADAHCTECAETAFGAEALDNDTARDGEGNHVHPVFSTDEGPIDEWGKRMSVYCGTCITQIYESPYDDLEVTLDGSYGGISALEYAERIASVVHDCGKKLTLDRAALCDKEWDFEELDRVIEDAFNLTGIIFDWNSGYPGCMMHGSQNAWDAFWHGGEYISDAERAELQEEQS